MKKKLASLLCIFAVILCAAGCGSSKSYNEVEQSKISTCEYIAANTLEFVMAVAQEDVVSNLTSNYNKEEMKKLFEESFASSFGYDAEIELGAFDGLIVSYVQMAKEMGGNVTAGGYTTDIVGKDIYVTYSMTGDNCDGQVKFTFSNDIFTRLKKGEATANTSFKQKMDAAGRQMGTAGLNTLLGMGSVFIVLILICLIISSFSLFNGTGKKKPTTVDKPAEPAAPEVVEDLSDDSELVAVITAAIYAFESANGSASSDGFVVRSIRKVNRRK